MRFKSLSATVFGLTLLVTGSVVLILAQQQVNPTTVEQVMPTSTQEDETPSYYQGTEISTLEQEDATQTQKQVKTGATAAARIDYSRAEPIPAKKSINQGLTSPSAEYMKQVLGIPGDLTENCSTVQDSRLKKLMVAQDVGPFKITGFKPAVSVLKQIFAQVKQENPQLYSQLGTAGMLCVRKVRGGSNFSNHSWGTAIDIKINQKLDQTGDNKTQGGLKALYPYFHKEKFYWGAEFPTEDSMHFEASKELIARWKLEDVGNPNPPSSSKYWVDTFPNAPGYSSPGKNRTGTLNKGTNYVFCRTKGPKVQVGSNYNNWWLKTDLDSGNPRRNQWVSAYYLKRWGNNEAKDNNGREIPNC